MRPGCYLRLEWASFLAIGCHPAGHGSHRHDRRKGRFSWVWKPGTGMQIVLSCLGFGIQKELI